MALKKSTKVWLVNLAASVLAAAAIRATSKDLGCLGGLAAANAIFSALVLAAIAIGKLFRLIVRRIALRLAFSYFLIGVVPIPLLTALLFAVGYVLASQVVGTRLRREVAAVVENAAALEEGLPEIRVEDHVVVQSDVASLRPGDRADWADKASSPQPLLEGETVWFVARPDPKDPGRLAMVSFGDPGSDFLQRVSDATGYEVRVGTARGERRKTGYQLSADKEKKGEWEKVARPQGTTAGGNSLWTREWLLGVCLERPVAALGGQPAGNRLVAFIARTSPQLLYHQLFSQGVSEVGRMFWGVVAGIGAALLLVYLVALGIAFYLVGSIATSINRLTRATQALAGGDFSVRVQSKSRDQVGDLARSFDGMAASIQQLLVQTAEKERLEGEIAVARTIQQKLLPPPEAALPGFDFLAHFQPVAEIGGDYYDYLSMPDGRTAVALGDVSGHGLPTGLLVAMAKAALTTQIESGLAGSPLFAKLNDLIHRSTDSRNYMTLTLLAYDAALRRADLTNAGQLAPYRISGGEVSSLSLPSFPLGAGPRSDFPSVAFDVAAGDRLLFLTDGLVEAANAAGEPFGFERLEALLKAEASAEATRIKDALLAAVSSHTAGAPWDDDCTILVLSFA